MDDRFGERRRFFLAQFCFFVARIFDCLAPFCEINGRQIDSNVAIAELSRMYGVTIDDVLDERGRADSLAYQSLVEDSLAW